MAAALAFLLSSAAIAGVVRWVLSTLGVGLVTYVGLNQVLTLATNELTSRLSTGNAEIVGMLGLGGVDIAINVVLSAFSIRLAMTVVKSFRAK